MNSFSVRNRQRCEAANGFNHPLASWSLSDWTTATLGELGEAANIVKKLKCLQDGFKVISGQDEATLREALADELADMMIYLDLLAQAAGFDPELIRDVKFAKTSAKIGYVENPS